MNREENLKIQQENDEAESIIADKARSDPIEEGTELENKVVKKTLEELSQPRRKVTKANLDQLNRFW